MSTHGETIIFATQFSSMKLRNSIFLITAILIADQAMKIWIKTSYPIGNVSEIFPWFHLHFIENSGMAWGLQIGNESGKLALTLFRLLAVMFGTWYLIKICREKYHKYFIVCVSLIYAGALGNLIDSMFYGVIFDKGLHFYTAANDYFSYSGIAAFSSNGYASLFQGSVVDMLYFPIFNVTLPTWFPIWAGEGFEFFSPIFNIADTSVSVGFITLLLFQNRIFKKKETEVNIEDKNTEL